MLDKLINILLIPAYLAGYILEFFWKLPKLFCKITINTYKYKTNTK